MWMLRVCRMSGRVDWWSFGILIYELLYGFTPFRGKKRDETFNNILKRPLSFPEQPEVSEQCKVRPGCPPALCQGAKLPMTLSSGAAISEGQNWHLSTGAGSSRRPEAAFAFFSACMCGGW